MIDYVSILKQNPNGVLATQDKERIKTRVFQYLFADGNKVYFCTSSEKLVYAQLQKNPAVSFCVYPQNFNPVLSINGNAVFVEDLALKARVLDENPLIKGIYNTPNNSIFKIFYIDVVEVETFSFTDGPKSYKL
ncbi:MAG: pyridoxamine 5'-phosphate oxidase family protein [Nitrososphaerota archaeon]|uniref:pyridoxamine 5'-phosphate oxidase family protein n=1 Tax=Candidatus Bathycorpusculum sp. TaxID=2994959 RepID=UPI002820C5B4|nr:pyridoxamine 5'-phosphate oxidase family protein [Candidatus Termiticorpusculum sp.]MCL2292486.1 pyridoxamine 5'-phosphate oxidase family protein [Candidatus Termiticorpusculum sp.]MDR0460779.1 pyridoxamine 5'-phosphate oxidase family protein [Nitrososphaerota archaeon]